MDKELDATPEVQAAVMRTIGDSYSSLGIQNMKVNGQPVGETETRAALAGDFGTPVLLLAGDRAAANEPELIVPEAQLAGVNEGLGRYTRLSVSAQEAREPFRTAATRAMEKMGRVKPYRVEGPVTLAPEADVEGVSA